MPILIPFASASSPACTQAWQSLKLPQFERLMQRMALAHSDTGNETGDEYTLSPPHERARAQALGMPASDGCTPWAAHALAQAPADTGYQHGQAWATITPCYWHVGVDQIQMLHPDALQINEADSRTVLEAMRPYFAEDGISLHYISPSRWVAQSPLFDGLATASLDRVAGRNVNAWMPEGTQAAPLRRLQNEMQMLLYTHPVNNQRQAAGLQPINSFWVSGAGALHTQNHTTTHAAPDMQTIDDLRQPALLEDWARWAAAWQHLDATLFQMLNTQTERGEAVELILCGERAAQHYRSAPVTLKSRFLSLLGQQSRNYLREQL
jgi:hypothetical protein